MNNNTYINKFSNINKYAINWKLLLPLIGGGSFTTWLASDPNAADKLNNITQPTGNFIKNLYDKLFSPSSTVSNAYHNLKHNYNNIMGALTGQPRSINMGAWNPSKYQKENEFITNEDRINPFTNPSQWTTDQIVYQYHKQRSDLLNKINNLRNSNKYKMLNSNANISNSDKINLRNRYTNEYNSLKNALDKLETTELAKKYRGIRESMPNELFNSLDQSARNQFYKITNKNNTPYINKFQKKFEDSYSSTPSSVI